jgi:hypothetical protein
MTKYKIKFKKSMAPGGSGLATILKTVFTWAYTISNQNYRSCYASMNTSINVSKLANLFHL